MIRRTPGCHRGGAFTLIEVLVVVAIIALLVAILLPSLKSAREQGKATICAAHLDQIFKASFMYSQEYQDRLPNFGWVVSDKWWPVQIAKPLGNQFDVYTCPSDKRPMEYFVTLKNRRIHINEHIQPGSVPIYVSYSGACDTVDPAVRTRKNPNNENPTETVTGRRITAFKRPGTSLIMIEGLDKANSVGGQQGGCLRYYRLLQYADRRGPRASQFMSTWLRHNGRTNMLFVDGHVDRPTPERVIDTIVYQQEFYSTSVDR